MLYDNNLCVCVYLCVFLSNFIRVKITFSEMLTLVVLAFSYHNSLLPKCPKHTAPVTSIPLIPCPPKPKLVCYCLLRHLSGPSLILWKKKNSILMMNLILFANSFGSLYYILSLQNKINCYSFAPKSKKV